MNDVIAKIERGELAIALVKMSEPKGEPTFFTGKNFDDSGEKLLRLAKLGEVVERLLLDNDFEFDCVDIGFFNDGCKGCVAEPLCRIKKGKPAALSTEPDYTFICPACEKVIYDTIKEFNREHECPHCHQMVEFTEPEGDK